jgi:TIR domain
MPKVSQMPLLFISHKHSDRRIAEVLARFVEERSAAGIKVHLSSSPDFQGPKFGKALNAQLREALWKTELLILVYTSADQDWSYCMWECGMAAHPQSPNTTVIVFQCGAEIPSPFQDVLRVNARNLSDIKRFVNQLLRDPAVFTSAPKAIAPLLKDTTIENWAKDLHTELAQVLPPLDDGQVEQWPAWPYLRLELPRTETDRIEQAVESERLNLSHRIVGDHAEVVRSDARVAQLFGKQGFPARFKFHELLNAWKNKYPDGDPRWFDSCCEQIMECARRGFPVISSASMREIGGDFSFTPVVTRVQRLPFSGSVQFDVYFFNLSDPRAVPVTSRMVPTVDLFYKRVGEIDPEAFRLKDLIQELTTHKRNRVPILTTGGAPLYIVHRSMIEQFIVKSVLQREGAKDPGDLTLADLLADPDMKSTFEKTYAVVSRQSTLAQAKAAMVAKDNCSDVFVTHGGTPQEAVLGLLTNVEIARGS